MLRQYRLAVSVLGSVCLLAWLSSEGNADAKNGKPTAPKGLSAKAKAKAKAAGQNKQTYGAAVRDLQEARVWLREAAPIFDGHRGRAHNHIDNALMQLIQVNSNGNTVAPVKTPKTAKGKAAFAAAAKKNAAGTSVVKPKDSSILPPGWEVANGQMQQAGSLVKSAISKMKGNDPHLQAASAQAQLALQEINASISFMNSLGGTAKSAAKQKSKR